RLSTPYRRSKPVAIAWPVNAVDMIASASTPGVTYAIRSPGTSSSGARENPTSTRTGMIIVSSSCSPLRSMPRISAPAWARTMRGSGAAPGAGVKSSVVMVPPRSRRRGSPQLAAGELEEDVLEGAALDAEGLGGHTLGGAPRRDRGEQLGADL